MVIISPKSDRDVPMYVTIPKAFLSLADILRKDQVKIKETHFTDLCHLPFSKYKGIFKGNRNANTYKCRVIFVVRKYHMRLNVALVSPTSIKTAKLVKWLQRHIIASCWSSARVQPFRDHAPWNLELSRQTIEASTVLNS